MKLAAAAYVAFAAFGVFWGTWGAALPALRDGAGLTDGQLGGALLWIGAGALPSMALIGRAIDRFGVRMTGIPLILLALTGLGLSLYARDITTLSIGMLLVGATSGAADVAANALAGLAERRSGRRVITLAHAVFSSFVVAGSLGAGALLAVSDGLDAAFLMCGLLVAAAGVTVLVLAEGPAPRALRPPSTSPDRRLRALLPFLAAGLIGALGFAIENAHQSWSAIFFADELHASPLITAFAPATFAAFSAATRFGVGAFRRIPDIVLLFGGAIAAAAGTLLLSASQSIVWAVVGLAVAAVGTSVLFPTLLSRATRDVPDEQRGRATSIVGTTAYLGFLLGPVYVGLLAGGLGLRTAMVGVAALALAFAVFAPAFTRRGQRADQRAESRAE